MWRDLAGTPEALSQFHEWIVAIYDDAASYAVKRLQLPIAQAVNHAILLTLEELQQRNAPAELVAEIESRLTLERRSLMFNLARQHGVRAA
ncbi:hypothetical protein IGS74_01540 [Aureimonas sp. OT7]|uniref:hypothetical protein n=1 Tax=Aureimonas TaxID=414371 RepID=UPI00177FDA5C|nr:MULTISPECIES: hypothetical protein [Aureimonas]QOG07003.1 hypothetical protein IGS74_01540 [Aureimonas sp. OT7]